MINSQDILETIKMITSENLDVRTVTMGISIRDCADSSAKISCEKIVRKITGYAKDLVKTCEGIEREYGIPIVNKRISVTPVSIVAESSDAKDYTIFAQALEKLEAMTCVCSVGLDMIALPGDIPQYVISAIIADAAAIGMINNKTTAVRLIPVPRKIAGDYVNFGGLLGGAHIIDYNRFSPEEFIKRGGRIPAPLNSHRN